MGGSHAACRGQITPRIGQSECQGALRRASLAGAWWPADAPSWLDTRLGESVTPVDESTLRERIRLLLAAGALDRHPERMPTRALSPAPALAGSPSMHAVPCRICGEAGAEVAFFDLQQRAETYVHSEPCARLWLEGARDMTA
jgi:hypothetical protein